MVESTIRYSKSGSLDIASKMIVASIQMWLRVVARRKNRAALSVRKPSAALTPNKVVRYVRWLQCDTIFEHDGSEL